MVTVLENLLKHMDREQFQPLIIASLPGPYVDRMTSLGCEVIVLNSRVGELIKDIAVSGKRNPLKYINLYRQMRIDAKKLRTILQKNNVDILHTHHHHHHILGGMSCKWQLSNIWHMHAVVNRKAFCDLSWMIFNFMAWWYAARIIAISNAVKNNMASLVKRKTTVVYNSVMLEEFGKITPAEAKHNLGFPEDRRIVGTVGRFVPLKGFRDFISMAEIVTETDKDVYFLIVAPIESPEESEYQKICLRQIEKAGLKDRFTIKNNLLNAAQFMPAIDIFILATVSWEGFGIAVLEAQASGKPAVVTDCGGPSDIIVDGQNGFIVPRMDYKTMADRVLKLLLDEELCRQMGAASRKRAGETQFNTIERVKQIENIYLSLAKN